MLLFPARRDEKAYVRYHRELLIQRVWKFRQANCSTFSLQFYPKAGSLRKMFSISCVSFLSTNLNIFHCPKYVTTYAVQMPTVLHVFIVCNRDVQIQGARSLWRPRFICRRLIFGNPQYGTRFLLPFRRLEF